MGWIKIFVGTIYREDYLSPLCRAFQGGGGVESILPVEKILAQAIQKYIVT